MRRLPAWILLPWMLLAGGCGDTGYVDVMRAHDDAEPGCSGECTEEFPYKKDGTWGGPVLLWMGPAAEAPACPDQAPAPAADGQMNLIVSDQCPACACDPPAGSCALPATFTAHSVSCMNLPGGVDTPSDPPSSWAADTCTDANKIPEGEDCGGTPCVRSVTIGPASVVNESECKPSSQQVPSLGPPAPTWGSYAKACQMSEQNEENHVLGECVDPRGHFCGPRADGFRLCFYHLGEVACPDVGQYPDRFVVYEDYVDDRACSDCTCGPPVGSVCEGLGLVYEDGTCTQEVGACMMDSSNGCCVDPLSGTALGSKKVTDLTYMPGTCEPSESTVIMGAVELLEPRTYCCWVPDEDE